MILRPNKQNWASMVKHLLSWLGFLEVWNAQGVGNIGNFLCTFKIRVKGIYVQDWHARLENSTRARFYINVAKFQFQKYPVPGFIKNRKVQKKLGYPRIGSRLRLADGQSLIKYHWIIDKTCCWTGQLAWDVLFLSEESYIHSYQTRFKSIKGFATTDTVKI